MKGAKGGKRDQLISNHFRKINEDIEKTANDNLEKEESALKFKANKKKKFEEKKAYEDKLKPLEKEDIETSRKEDFYLDIDLKDKKLQTKENINDEEKNIVLEDKEQEKESFIHETIEEKEVEKNKNFEKQIQKENIHPIKEENKEPDGLDEFEEEVVAKEEEITTSDLDRNKEKEAVVFYELQKMIKEDYYDVKELEYKIDIISTKVEQEVLKDEIDKLKQELEALLKQFNAIKDKYDYLDIGKNLAGIHSLNSEYIENMVEDYKKDLKESLELQDLIKQIEQTKDYIGIVETLIITENKRQSLEQKLDEKCDEYDIRDKEFASLEEMATDVEKINDEVAKCSKEIETATKVLEEKVKEAVHVTTRRDFYTELVPHINRALNASLLLAASMMMPHNLAGNMIKAGLIAGAINNMAHIIEPEEKVKQVKTISYTDYNKDIMYNMQSIQDAYLIVDTALDNIYDIEEKFKKEFKQYEGLIPGYKELMENIYNIQNELEEQQYFLEKYDKQLKEQYIKNDSKKYIKEYEQNHI